MIKTAARNKTIMASLFAQREKASKDQRNRASIEPRLWLRVPKKLVRFQQVPWEHVVIPYNSLNNETREIIDQIKSEKIHRAAVTLAVGSVIVPLVTGLSQTTLPVWKKIATSALTASIPAADTLTGVKPRLEKIKYLFSEKEERGIFPAKNALIFEDGEYREVERSSEIASKIKRMTHGTVDNAGNIILVKHPLDGVAKARGFKERLQNLRKWLLWKQPFQRLKFELQPPRRWIQETAPAKKKSIQALEPAETRA